MKYLIAGLGNVGAEYDGTRHNIGFTVSDALASASGTVFKQEKLAYRTEIKHRGRTLVIIKPTTFMNLSGKAVNYWMQAEKIPLDRTLIVTDDIAIPFGQLRLRAKGSDGGHNGLKDINATLGRQDYPRLRFGVGNDFGKGQQVQYVLGKWSTEDQETLDTRVKLAVDCIKSFAAIGLGRTMNDFNKR